MEDAYIQGFIDKCAEHGVDPETLTKGAQQGGLLMNSANSAKRTIYNNFNPKKLAQQFAQGSMPSMTLYGAQSGQGTATPNQSKPLFDASSVQTTPYTPPAPARQVRKTYAPGK
jgi:hypothetical protein